MYKLDYYKQLIDVVITYKNCNKYDLDEILSLLPDDDVEMIKLVYQYINNYNSVKPLGYIFIYI